MSVTAKLTRTTAFSLVAALLVLVPADFSAADGLRSNEACAGPGSGGACCMSVMEICWGEGGTLYNHYYSSTGRCGGG